MGRSSVPLDGRTHHRAVRVVRRPRSCLHRSSSLAAGHSNRSSQDLFPTHNPRGMHSIHWHRLVDRDLCLLPAHLVPSYPGEIATKLRPFTCSPVAQQCDFCRRLGICDEPPRILHPNHDHRGSGGNCGLSTDFDVGSRCWTRPMDMLSGMYRFLIASATRRRRND